MLENYEVNIFVRVMGRRMKAEKKTADEILNTYPALTEQEAKNIKVKL